MKSMTGMGRAQGSVQGAQVRIEIRSINHRFCEVNTRMPSRYMPLEILVQQHIKKSLNRGKIDIYINEEKNTQLSTAEIEAYKSCFAYYKSIQQALHLDGEIKLQDLISGIGPWIQREVDAEKLWKDMLPILQAAIDDLMRMRTQEGANLKKEMLKIFKNIERIAGEIEALKDNIQTELQNRLKEKIQTRMQELGELDPARLQMEVVYYLDRMDVTEELHRLKSHFDQINVFFADDAPMGRKIDFLLQEFNREFNTIGSKSQSSVVAHLVVEAKAELEKVREQVQNVE